MAYELRCFPSTDEEFVRDALTWFSRFGHREPLDDDGLAEWLQACLRAIYPRVRVIRASPLATYGGERILYAYRDGRAVAKGASPEA